MTEKIQDNINAFLKVLDADDYTTGGGTASCIAGSMAAGMVGMVANLSKDKNDLLPEKVYEKIAARAAELQKLLFDGGATDTLAFKLVSDAFKMPKLTKLDKKQRSQAIQKGFAKAAKVPLENATYCMEVHDLCLTLSNKYNQNCESDLFCAQMLSSAGIRGCIANVEINLSSIKDGNIVEELTRQLKIIKGAIPT